MSRHKLVKALDLDEELKDFQGDAESDYEEEVSAEDKGMQSFNEYPLACQGLNHRLTGRLKSTCV